FFQAEDGIRDFHVTGVQTCALPISEEIERARDLARRLGIPYIAREGSIEALGAKAVLVVTKERLVVETAAGPLFFHPGMARPRIRSLERGEADVMVEDMQLRRGDHVRV